MEQQIQSYVDDLFQNAPRTQKAFEWKTELTQNLLDKYHTLLAEGKSPEDAYKLTVMSIGDVEELFRGLEDDPVPTPIDPSANAAKQSAALVSIAVMLYILSVVPVIVLGYIGQFVIQGVVLMFVMIAVATGLLVFRYNTRPRRTPFSDAAVLENKRWQDQPDSQKQLLRAIRSAYWPLVLALYFLLSFGTGKWHITWILFLIAPAVDSILKAVLVLRDTGKK